MTVNWDKYNTIIFDLDGTLINSAKDLVDSLNIVVIEQGLQAVPFHIARPFAGVGSYALLECAYEFNKKTLDLVTKETLRTAFLEVYTDRILNNTTPFDGADEKLKSLKAQGKNLILATNKPERFTKIIMAHLKWGDLFDAVVCPENVSARKPDGAHLKEALEIAGIVDDNPLMIGDSYTDYNAALACGFDVAMINFAYSDITAFPDATYYLEEF